MNDLTFMRSIINNLPMGYSFFQITLDEQGNPVDMDFLEVNLTFERITGLKGTEVIGKKLSEIFPDLAGGIEWTQFYKKIVLSSEGKYLRHYVPHTLSWYNIYVYSPQKGHIVTLFTNITQQIEEYENFNDLVTSLDDIFFELDRNYVFRNVWVANEELLMMPKSKLMGKNIRDILPEDILTRSLNALEKAAITKEPVYYDYSLSNGKWYQGRVLIKEDSFKNIKYIIATSDISNRKQLELDYIKKSEELERFFTINLDLLCIADVRGNFIKVNKAWEDILGYKSAELESRRFLDFVHPEDIESTLKAMEQLSNQETVINFINRYRTKEGSYRYIEWRSHPYGNLIYAAARDISKRVEMEQLICSSQQEKSLVLDSIQELVIYFDNTMGIIWANSKAAEALNKKHEELKGTKCFEFFHNVHHLCQECPANTSLTTGKTISKEIAARDNSFWLMTASPVKDEIGNIKGVVVTALDITERKQAETIKEKLLKEQELLLDNISSQIWYLKDAQTYGAVNKAHAEFFGVDKKYLEDRSIYEFMACHEADICTLGNNDVFANKKQIEVEEWVYNGKGEIRLLNIVKTPKLDDNGNVEYVVCCGNDITERNKYEIALQYQLDFQKMLTEISAGFVNLTSDKLDEKIEYSLKKIGEFFNAMCCYVYLFSDDGKILNNTYNWCGEAQEGHKEKELAVVDIPWWIEQISNREYIMINDYKLLSLEAQKELDMFRQSSGKVHLSIPIVLNDKVNGFLGIDIREGFDLGSKEQLQLIKVVAEIISYALGKRMDEAKINRHTLELELTSMELEELYHQLEEEINKAKEIHQRTLPRDFPEIQGITFGAYYRPARLLGGDFYDVIKKDNKLIIYLSDVTGHGLDGAMMSLFVKNTINSYVPLVKKDNITPTEIASFLYSQFIKENYPSDYFICIFIGVLDLETMELSYTGAGFQDVPLAQLGDGKRTKLTSMGLPISAAIPKELLDFKEDTITLTHGTTILFNTDGLTEQTINNIQYGSRLDEVFYENCHLPPEIIVQSIAKDFREFNNGIRHGKDDITFLVLQTEKEHQEEMIFELESSFNILDYLNGQIMANVEDFVEKDIFLNCIHELVINAIEHGNKFSPNKKVKIRIINSAEFIYATVEDEGEGFNWQAKIERPIEFEGDEERGRGIAMTKLFSNSLSYNEKGNKSYLFFNKVP